MRPGPRTWALTHVGLLLWEERATRCCPLSPPARGAAGSGASGGRLWVGSGCPSHLLPGPWWPLSFRCWLTGPRAAVREPDSVTAPNPQHWPEAATLTSWWSPQRPPGLPGTTVSWWCIPGRPRGGTAGSPGGLALSWTRRLGGVRAFPLPARVLAWRVTRPLALVPRHQEAGGTRLLQVGSSVLSSQGPLAHRVPRSLGW